MVFAGLQGTDSESAVGTGEYLAMVRVGTQGQGDLCVRDSRSTAVRDGA